MTRWTDDTLLDWNLGQDDPHDHYPWTWTPYLDADGGADLGSITTPNGQCPHGRAHTYWGVAHGVWEPEGRLICALVNQWAHEQFGTTMTNEHGIVIDYGPQFGEEVTTT